MIFHVLSCDGAIVQSMEQAPQEQVAIRQQIQDMWASPTVAETNDALLHMKEKLALLQKEVSTLKDMTNMELSEDGRAFQEGSRQETPTPMQGCSKVAEIVRTRETAARLSHLGVHPDVFSAVRRLACRYATCGIEGVKKGHIFVVGDPRCIMQKGSNSRPRYAFVKAGPKGDRFCGGSQRVTVQEDSEIVLKELNHDGMTVVDGETGVVVHNSVFSRISSDRFQGGGARAASSAGLADAAQCVCVMISEDPPPPLGLIRTFWGSDTHYTEERMSHGHVLNTSTHNDGEGASDRAQSQASSPRSTACGSAICQSPVSTYASECSCPSSVNDFL